ncbi:MAG: hypothetical protein HQ541_15225 [Mariniphaga sp.]|nr:hypothetical protein [Mariniphaga sp.]
MMGLLHNRNSIRSIRNWNTAIRQLAEGYAGKIIDSQQSVFECMLNLCQPFKI